MFEIKNESTLKFLDSLKNVAYRIKKDGQWYELRVDDGIDDDVFVDKAGELYGVKNAKINFYIFKTGTNEIPDWVPECLRERFQNFDFKDDDDRSPWIGWEICYCTAFIQFLLEKGGFVVFDRDGYKQEKWSNDVEY